MCDTPRAGYPPGLLAAIKADAPKLWESLERAASLGLIFMDEEQDAITATNRLLLTYPDLHGVLNQVIDHWSRKDDDRVSEELAAILFQTGAGNEGNNSTAR